MMALVHEMSALSLHEEDNSSFDVFFIYKTTNLTSSWVRSTCQDLERIHIVPGYHEKDFMVGRQVSENIVKCIKKSKKVGIVVTPDFLESHWCKFDLDITLLSKIPHEGQILPLFLNVTPEEIPIQLRTHTGIDVSGPRDEWWDKLVRSLRDSNPDDVQSINYYIRKCMEAIMSASVDSTVIANDVLLRSPLDHFQRQMGSSFVQGMLLSSCGISINNRSLQIDFATLFPEGHRNSKLLPLRSVFNEFCLNHYIIAALSFQDSDKEDQGFPSACEIKFYGINAPCVDNMRLAVSFTSPMEILLKHGRNNVLSISNESAKRIVESAAVTQTDLQLRSKRSRGLRNRFSPYRIFSHSTRGCRNYRNYRKVLFTFPEGRLSARYTFFPSNVQGSTERSNCPADNETFLFLRKFSENGQFLVF